MSYDLLMLYPIEKLIDALLFPFIGRPGSATDE